MFEVVENHLFLGVLWELGSSFCCGEMTQASYLRAMEHQPHDHSDEAHDHHHHDHGHSHDHDHDHGTPREMLQDAMTLVQAEDLHRAFHLWEHLSVSSLEEADLLQAFGYLALEFGKEQVGITAFNKALRLDASLAQSWLLLGNAYRRLKKYKDAEKAFREVIKREPENTDGHYNLAITLEDNQQYEAATKAAEAGLKIDPFDSDLHNAAASAFHALADLTKAEEHYRTAIKIDPAFAPLKFNLSQVLLQAGQWQEGWELYDSRLQFRDAEKFPETVSPTWKGEDLQGKRILVWAEQGFGDTLQFVRLIPLLAEKGAEIVLRVQGALLRLLQDFPSVVGIIADDENIPSTDFEIPLLSLPRYLDWQSTLGADRKPYLTGAESFIPELRDRSEEPHVGLVWAGNPNHPDDLKRSMNGRAMAPLLDVTSLRFVSLQVGGRSKQWQDKRLLEVESWLDDFKETAAAIATLDLVITVDTAVAHLAGAMGKPVWMLADYAGDWRWGLHADRSDWYPTMRIFRQPKPGDWSSVIATVKKELLDFKGA